MESRIRFLTLNIGMKSNLAGLTTILESHRIDIAFLQEVKSSEDEINSKVEKLGYISRVNLNSEEPAQPGTALVWKTTLPMRDINSLVTCRLQVAFLGDLALLNLYAPSGSDKKYERGTFFSQSIFQALNIHPTTKWILGGDFNCVLQPVDIENGVGFDQKGCHQLADLVRIKNFKDVFRSTYPNRREFTFFRSSASPSRLDRFYIAEDLLGKTFCIEHIASLSDHCGVKMEVSLNIHLSSNTQKNGRKTYWKLNNNILNDDDFLDSFVLLWDWLQPLKLNYRDIADWWDRVAKPSFREFCVIFSSRRSKRRSDTKKFWFAYLKLVMKLKNWDEVTRIKNKLSKLLYEDNFGHIIRSRFKNNALEERASLYHANQEMKNGKKNSLTELKIDGKVEKDAKVIEENVVEFFNALLNGHHDSNLQNTGAPFQPDYSGLDSYLQGLGSLPGSDKEELENRMSIEELRNIVSSCDNNKSPGLDGLSYEFYKATLNIIEKDLLEVLQCQLDRGRIIESNVEGVTRLCPKVEGVPSVDELRPITLLNCDYKILSKWLVLRVKPKLPLIIKSGQLCTVGKKNILFGVSNILSSIFQVQQGKKQGCLISLDFFKAYDRVLLDFLVKVMQKMNFGKVFISWIIMLHKGAKTRFLLGFLTRAIQVRFSIRQGDPLAMILYIIYVEPLLIALEKALSGLKLECGQQTLEAYCDDINVMTDDLEDFGRLELIIAEFERYSGAILSREKKCKIIGFGNWANRVAWPITWLSPVSSVKIFGVFISDSYPELLNTNWDFRFQKFRNAVFSWSGRRLSTLQQRVEVIRVFALSRVYYISSILPIKPSMVKKFEALIGKFIWHGSGKILRVALGELKNDHLAGGLNLPCLTTMSDSLLTSQCVRVLRSGDSKSVAHLDYWLGSLVADIMPGLGLGREAVRTHEYFVKIADCVALAMMSETLTASSVSSITNRIIYKDFATFPTPKIEIDSVHDYKLSWKRLQCAAIEGEPRDLMFLLIHNKLPVPERLFRIGTRADPYCSHCPDAVVGDIVHFFCDCQRTKECWAWTRLKISRWCQQDLRASNWELLNFFIPNSQLEQEIVWLLSSYIFYVWNQCQGKNRTVVVEKFFGFLSFKYKAASLLLRQNLDLS